MSRNYRMALIVSETPTKQSPNSLLVTVRALRHDTFGGPGCFNAHLAPSAASS